MEKLYVSSKTKYIQSQFRYLPIYFSGLAMVEIQFGWNRRRERGIIWKFECPFTLRYIILCSSRVICQNRSLGRSFLVFVPSPKHCMAHNSSCLYRAQFRLMELFWPQSMARLLEGIGWNSKVFFLKVGICLIIIVWDCSFYYVRQKISKKSALRN